MTRMQKKRLLLAGKRMAVLQLLIGLVMASGMYVYWQSAAVPAASMSTGTVGRTLLGMASWQDILFWGIPGLAEASQVKKVKPPKREMNASDAVSGVFAFFTNINSRDLRSVLRAELPSLALVPAQSASVSANRPSEDDTPKFTQAKTRLPGKPLVGIYHTHTAESFIPSTGVAHRPGGQIGEICDVGKALVETLENNGIPAIQDVTINDYPSFMKAYSASEVTLKRMLKENPSLQMVFDLHRDAEKREYVVSEINGKTAAKISIIVAQGQKDLPQPNWKKNYAMAKLIDRKLNEKYPGLSRGIQLVEWRYNQHLHPHALIIEVGSHETSTQEAIYAIQMLGNVLTEILNEENK